MSLGFSSGDDIKRSTEVKLEVCLQNGVLRTNCIDCLDRTNVAQFAFGMVALGKQLSALGLMDDSPLELNSGVVAVLMDMYQVHGVSVVQLQQQRSVANFIAHCTGILVVQTTALLCGFVYK